MLPFLLFALFAGGAVLMAGEDGGDGAALGEDEPTSSPSPEEDEGGGPTEAPIDTDEQVQIGTPGADLLQGGAGNDDLRGSFGPDIVIGGGGDDSLNGGAGDDVLLGQGGADSLLAAGGSDGLIGGAGNDLLSGGGGDDALFGGLGADTLNGGSGDDVIFGLVSPDLEAALEGLAINAAQGASPSQLLAQAEAAVADVPGWVQSLVDQDQGDIIDGGGGNDIILAGAGDVVTSGGGIDNIGVLSAVQDDGGATDPVTITDYDAARDALTISVQTGRFDLGGQTPETFFEVTSASVGEDTEVYLNGAHYITLLNTTGFDASSVNIVLIPA